MGPLCTVGSTVFCAHVRSTWAFFETLVMKRLPLGFPRVEVAGVLWNFRELHYLELAVFSGQEFVVAVFGWITI